MAEAWPAAANSALPTNPEEAKKMAFVFKVPTGSVTHRRPTKNVTIASDVATPAPPPFAPGSAPRSSTEFSRIELMSTAECKALGLEYPMYRLPPSFFNERTLKRFPLNLAHKYKLQQMAGDTGLPDINFGRSSNAEEAPPRARQTGTASSTVTSRTIGSCSNTDQTRETAATAWTPSAPPSAMTPPQPMDLSLAGAKSALSKYRCPHCKNVYKHRGTLKKHLISGHNILDDVPELDPVE